VQIKSFKQCDENAWSPNFKSWKQRNQQSLKEIFGENHDYYLNFKRISFWHTRIGLMKAPSWSSEDQQKFEQNLAIAESIVSDALEECNVEPPTATKSHTESTRPKTTPQIIVNVNNVLSQTTEVHLSQIINSLDELNLPPDKHKDAEKLATELEAESKGKKRWSVLAKSLDALKGMGKAVYERVAIPLLLDMLKKEAGL
jgi:hypothetical protein